MSGLKKQDYLYNLLLNRLIEAQYVFGQDLKVRELCEELGVTRQPMMAAIARLATNRFVSITPQVGCKVVDPSKSEITDFCRMFGRIEGLIAEIAAERASDSQVEQLRLANLAIHRIGESGASDEHYRLLNSAFHHELYAISNSPSLLAIQSNNIQMMDFIFAQMDSFKRFRPTSVDEHDDIIEALRKRDGRAAQRAAEQHVLSALTSVLRHRI